MLTLGSKPLLQDTVGRGSALEIGKSSYYLLLHIRVVQTNIVENHGMTEGNIQISGAIAIDQR